MHNLRENSDANERGIMFNEYKFTVFNVIRVMSCVGRRRSGAGLWQAAENISVTSVEAYKHYIMWASQTDVMNINFLIFGRPYTSRSRKHSKHPDASEGTLSEWLNNAVNFSLFSKDAFIIGG